MGIASVKTELVFALPFAIRSISSTQHKIEHLQHLIIHIQITQFFSVRAHTQFKFELVEQRHQLRAIIKNVFLSLKSSHRMSLLFVKIFPAKNLYTVCHQAPAIHRLVLPQKHFFVTKKQQFFASNNFALHFVLKIETPLNRNILFPEEIKYKINEWTALWSSVVVIRSTDRKRMFSDRAQHKSINRPTLDRGVYAAESERTNCLLIRAYQIPKGKKAADGPTVRMHITQYWLLRLNNLEALSKPQRFLILSLIQNEFWAGRARERAKDTEQWNSEILSWLGR